MQGDRFDDKIRELLNGVHEDYDNASWDALSERMDREEIPAPHEETFIPVVKQKLHNHRVTVPEEHWTSLKSDLDYIQERRERLYIIKALEAAIVLLLVYTYFNYQGFSTEVDMDLSYIEQVQEDNSKPQMIEASISLNQETSDQDFVEVKLNQVILHSESSIIKLPFSTLAQAASTREKKFIHSVPNPSIEVIPSTTLALLSTAEIGNLSTGRSLPAVPERAPFVAYKEVDISQEGWSIGLPFSYDVNFINTDINIGYLSNQIKTGLAGRSFGVSVAYRMNKYEIESGLRYSEKTFVPGQLTNYAKSGVNSFLESQLDHMVIKQLSIPIFGKIYASPYKKATLYGVAGISINTIIDNVYAIRRTNQIKARLENAPTTDVVDLKNLPRGLAHGGSFEQNIYMTGVVGFGVQSYLTNGVNWYIQPLYQHSFKSEINQLVDRINTLSIEAGIKFSF